jgi:hypothetical protein
MMWHSALESKRADNLFGDEDATFGQVPEILYRARGLNPIPASALRQI